LPSQPDVKFAGILNAYIGHQSKEPALAGKSFLISVLQYIPLIAVTFMLIDKILQIQFYSFKEDFLHSCIIVYS